MVYARQSRWHSLTRGDWPTPVPHVGKLIKIRSTPRLALLSEQCEVPLHADFGEPLRA